MTHEHMIQMPAVRIARSLGPCADRNITHLRTLRHNDANDYALTERGGRLTPAEAREFIQ